MAEDPPPKSSDGWIGDPNILLAQQPKDSLLSRFSGFHSFNLTRRIFLATFIALAVLLVGALLVAQANTQFSLAAKTYLNEHADYIKATYEQALEKSEGNTNFNLLENAQEALITHRAVTLEIYTDEFELVSQRKPSIYHEEKIELESEAPKETLWETTTRIFGSNQTFDTAEFLRQFSKILMSDVVEREIVPKQVVTQSGDTIFGVARALTKDGTVVGYAVIQTPNKLVTTVSSVKGRGLFAFFGLAMLIGLMLAALLARAITNPLNDLARAAEIGKAADLGYDDAHKALIPNLAGRTDVIGRLSGAMSDMTSALYERIATNESFAADVAHEIKNPLASMRSAVETLRVAKEGKGKAELLDILEMDVRRLDRLVSDISNASRLDAELVSEETERFELTKMLSNIVDFHRMEADDIGIELYWEGPSKPIYLDGLEERLAQVFVNLVTNAVSFCESGDAIRVWCRVRNNRILAVVEDTGPGIPQGSLTEIFRRFYSQRPTDDFGNHSGLGLAISKQIVEAHGGTIWAENIRKTDDLNEPVLGARFVVGFPI